MSFQIIQKHVLMATYITRITAMVSYVQVVAYTAVGLTWGSPWNKRSLLF